jgi:predicted nucleic acid-binding protein
MGKASILQDIYRYYGTANESAEIQDRKGRLRLAEAAKKNFREKQAFLDEISRLFEDYEVDEWENMDICCYEFKVALHLGSDSQDKNAPPAGSLESTGYDLNVLISTVGPYYCSCVERARPVDEEDEEENTILDPDQYPVDARDAAAKLERHFERKGYEVIPIELARTIIPDIESTYKDFGEFTIFNGLFTDAYDV